MKKIYFFIIGLLFIGVQLNAQVSSCANAVEFCTSSNYYFSNVTGVASLGANGVYGCLGTTPNAKWFYMQVTTGGNIIFTINQTNIGGTPLDVDFVCWGPFASPGAGCTVIGDTSLGAGAIANCSYSGSASEVCTLNGTVAGQYYILLCTNYSNQAGNITFVQSVNSTGTSLCTSSCSVSSIDAIPTVCSAPSNTYTLNGQVYFTSAPATGTLTVTTTGGASITISPPWISPVNFTIPNIQSNGVNCTVHASFSDEGSCFQTTTYAAPLACIPCVVAVANNGPTCVGDTVKLTATAVSGGTYSWTGPNGFTSILQNPTILSATSAAGGTYTLVVTVTSSGMTCTQSTNVTIHTTPSVSVNSPTICSGQTVTLTATSPTPGGNFLWSPSSDTAHSITITPMADTTYIVSYFLSGCSNLGYDTAIVTVIQRPTVTCNSDSICAGQSAVLTATPSASGGTYYWSNTGQTTPSITVTPNATTAYLVFYTLNGCANTVAGIVTVLPIPPTPVISQFGTLLASSSSTGNQWYWNDTLITGTTGQLYTVTQNGNYYVIVNANGCNSDTSLSVQFLTTDLENASTSNLFMVYPNPTTSSSTLYYSLAKSSNVTIEVNNNLGEKVLSVANMQQQSEGKYKYEFSLKEAGIYFVKMQTEGGVFVKRIVCIK